MSGSVQPSPVIAPSGGRFRSLLQRAPRLWPGYDTSTQAAEPLGRLGDLEVCLATRATDIRRAQRLRYEVFCAQGQAETDLVGRLQRRDIDGFDAICDHLLVLDHAASTSHGRPHIVGTYRLLRQEVAERHAGFYSAGQFDLVPLLSRHRGVRFLELGRSCVLAPYRHKRTIALLWHGIWTYVLRHRIDAMFGCASFEGLDPDRLALPLSFLHHHALASPEWSVSPLQGRGLSMARMPCDGIDPRAAMREMPPLLKGYLRLGATFGNGAVPDRRFGTTDVFVLLPVATISARYVGHFGADAGRYTA